MQERKAAQRQSICHWEIKGRFRKRVVLANVLSFRFSFRGNMRTYPRSGFRWTLFRGNIRAYPRSGFSFRGNIRQNHPFGNHPCRFRWIWVGYPADVRTDVPADAQRPQLLPSARSAQKKHFFCVDVPDPNARTSMTRGNLRKKYAGKLRADFRSQCPGRNYIRPPSSPVFWQESFFQGEGGCIFWSPPRQEFHTPPPFLDAPNPQKGIFRDGGVGCIRPPTIRGPKKSSNSKVHPKPSQEFREQIGPFHHQNEGFWKNSHQKVHPKFAKGLGRRILGNTFSGPKLWWALMMYLWRMNFTLACVADVINVTACWPHVGFDLLPSVPKLLHYSTLLRTINFGRRNVIITSQKSSWNYFWEP